MRPAPALAAFVLLLAPAALAGIVDEDLAPGGTVLSTVVFVDEVETWRVAAPAGSLLKVDLRPLAKKSAFLPLLEATLPDGSAATIPAPKKGRTKASLPFGTDGTVVLRVRSSDGTRGDYRLKTKLAGPKSVALLGEVAAGSPAALPFLALPRSRAAVKVRSAPSSALVPRILSLSGPGGAVLPKTSAPGPRSDAWRGVSLEAPGPWTLTVGGEGGSTGAFSGKVKWKAGRGSSEDHRDTGGIEGSYDAFLLGSFGTSTSTLPLLTGGLDIDAAGGAATALATFSLAPDAASPLGFSLGQTPLPPGTGTCRSDGTRAVVALDLGDAGTYAGDFAVAAGGSILYTDPAASVLPTSAGLLLQRTSVPAAADLAGSWFYAHAVTGDAGSSTVEIGTMSLGAAGTATGIGARTSVTLDTGGNPVLGNEVAVVRTGTFSVGADGTVTFTTGSLTLPDFSVGPQETWSSRVRFKEDILAGAGPLEAPASELTLLLRQGTGLSNADATGAYLHFGVSAGTALSLRTGTLTFDGAGAFSGTETVADLGGGIPGIGVPTAGTYSLQSSGIATVSFTGGGSGTGIVGPAADYLFTVALGAGGLGIDFFLGLE